jgi:hypothetical protein
MTSTSTLGSGTSDAAALATAFTLASNFADTNSATTPGRNIPTGLAVPTTLINTLADIVSTCVNTTGGVAGDSTPCGNLFSYANSPTTPTTVVGALLNIFANPTNNITSLLGLATGVGAPFQPALTVPPPNWTVALNTAAPPVTGSPSSFSFGATSVNAVSSGLNITITNTGSANATLTSLSITGANASSFFIVGGNCPTTLGAGSSCFVTLTFYPTATGIFYADLAIANSGSATPVYVALTGTGI